MIDKIRCPNENCKKLNSFSILHSGENNTGGLWHFHVKCICGRHFNIWDDDNKVRQVFKENYNLYK